MYNTGQKMFQKGSLLSLTAWLTVKGHKYPDFESILFVEVQNTRVVMTKKMPGITKVSVSETMDLIHITVCMHKSVCTWCVQMLHIQSSDSSVY